MSGVLAALLLMYVGLLPREIRAYVGLINVIDSLVSLPRGNISPSDVLDCMEGFLLLFLARLRCPVHDTKTPLAAAPSQADHILRTRTQTQDGEAILSGYSKYD